MRLINTVAVTIAFAAFGAIPVGAQSGIGYRDVFGTGVTIGEDADIGVVMSTALYRDGSLLVLDYARKDLMRMTPDGRVQWRFGRSGGGPGEFLTPTLVTVLQDQSALVFDLHRPNAATRVSADGKFVEQIRMTMNLSVRGASVLPSGEVILAGNTADARGREASLHLFTSSLEYIRSFGPLPVAPREMINLSGVGLLSVGAGGDIIFTRRYPYEVYRYDKNGKELQRTVVPLEVSRMEEETLKSESGGRVTYTHDKTRFGPGPARDLGNGWLLTRRNTSPPSMDIVNSVGQIVGSFKLAGSEHVTAIDYSRRQFWISAEKDDVPVLRVVPFGPRLR